MKCFYCSHDLSEHWSQYADFKGEGANELIGAYCFACQRLDVPEPYSPPCLKIYKRRKKAA